jgi:hypothetical protein
MGYPIYVTKLENLPEQMPIKSDSFHLVSDSYFLFNLESSGSIKFDFSNTRAIAWAACGGFFKAELFHAMLVFSGREQIHFWISQKGLDQISEGGIVLPPIDPKIGIGWDQDYKIRAKREGKTWKKAIINRLNTQVSEGSAIRKH